MTAVEPIERIAVGDRTAFDARVRGERPCVIAGGCASWPATRWTIESLSARVGDVVVKHKISATGVHPNFAAASLKEMFATGSSTLRELFANLTPEKIFTGDEQFLLRVRDGQTQVFEPFRTLLDDVELPVPADRLYTVWAWFSGRGAKTGLHYDNNGCHNLNAQLVGRKQVTLFAPSEVDRVGLFPIGGPNPAVNCSPLSVDQIDASRITGEVEAGDLLFIPAWWIHAFSHLGDFNANVNWWWRPDPPSENAVSRRDALTR